MEDNKNSNQASYPYCLSSASEGGPNLDFWQNLKESYFMQNSSDFFMDD